LPSGGNGASVSPSAPPPLSLSSACEATAEVATAVEAAVEAAAVAEEADAVAEGASAAWPPARVAARVTELKGEDAHVVQAVSIGGERVLCCAVADGHGGKAASAHIARRVVAHVRRLAGGDPSAPSLRAACTACFELLHAEVLSLPGAERGAQCTAGSTLTLCLLNEARRQLVVGNVGDSQALLLCPTAGAAARGELHTRFVTTDHRLQNNRTEQGRVIAAGGHLGKVLDATGRPAGPLRVFPGGLAMARTIGDADAGVCISPLPDVTFTELPSDSTLVTASPQYAHQTSRSSEALVKQADPLRH